MASNEPRPLPSPESRSPLRRVARFARRPLERFLRLEAASGLILLFAAAVALAWANSPWAESYARFWRTPLAFERSLEWIVSDGLMVIFFFVVGMEIRRELHHGELSDWRRAALPAAAALGGMLAPAALYLILAGAPETRAGWGVPMATDIAFAVGVLTLLGRRVPPSVRVLLLALAVIDDLGAIVVIALFYSSGITPAGFLVAALGFGGVLAMQHLGVRSKLAYIAPAVVAWAGVYDAGIHPTIAGVLIGLMTPVVASSENELASPSESLIETLHPWVAYGIMPVFALANAGVTVQAGALDAASWSVLSAVAVGLLLGKPTGILLACWLTLRLGISKLPTGVTLRHLVVLGLVAAIGFTMALFIAQLAFTDPKLLAAAKIGVLGASGAAGVIGLVVGRLLLKPPAPTDHGESRAPARTHSSP